jgi:hypothetical protein
MCSTRGGLLLIKKSNSVFDSMDMVAQLEGEGINIAKIKKVNPVTQ